MFLLELSFYSLRNPAMKQRIANLLHTVRSERPLPQPANKHLNELDTTHIAALDIAMDLGIALQTLLDPHACQHSCMALPAKSFGLRPNAPAADPANQADSR